MNHLQYTDQSRVSLAHLPEALHDGRYQVDRVEGGQADQEKVEGVAQLLTEEQDEAERAVARDACK